MPAFLHRFWKVFFYLLRGRFLRTPVETLPFPFFPQTSLFRRIQGAVSKVSGKLLQFCENDWFD